MLGGIKNIVESSVPAANAILFKGADAALNYHMPKKFLCGHNIDHIVRISKFENLIHIYDTNGDKCTCADGSEKYKIINDFLESQDMNATSIVNNIKNTLTE